MQRLGMVYFAIVGGAAALETTQIEEIEEVAWEELMPECLWKFRVKDFGPLTVGIDAHGNSLYHDVQAAREGEAEGDLCLGFESRPAGAPAAGLTHVIDKGLGLRDWRTSSTPRATSSTSSSSAGARATSRTTSRRRSRSAREKPVVCGGTFFEVVYAQGRSTSSSVARRARLRPRRDLRRHARHPARAQARADRRLRARLHRPLRGRLEGLGGRLRGRPVGRVDQGGARRRRLEGDHRGARGRHRRHLRRDGRDAHGPDRRDRPRDRGLRPDLRGADEGEPGVVRQALRARR